MKRILLAIAVLALSVAPAFAAGEAGHDMQGMPGMNAPTADVKDGQFTHSCMDGMKKQNPQHLLMMAYHKNVVMFGRALAMVAKHGDTVPADFARATVAEMKRSVEEMEKYRAGAMAGMPADMQGADMQKMMDEHLVTVKTHLRQLDELTKSDNVPSAEVLKHLDPILAGCESCEMMHGGMHMHGKGMHGEGMAGCPKGMHDCGKGMHDCGKGMHDCGKGMHDCGEAMHDCEQGGMPGCRHEGRPCHDCMEQGQDDEAGMMQQHHQKMHEMTQKLKAQDAEMLKMVDKVKRAPKARKLELLTELVAKMVQQRAEMTAQMEKMQKQSMAAHMHHKGAGASCPHDMRGMHDMQHHHHMQDAGDDEDAGGDDMNMDNMEMNQ